MKRGVYCVVVGMGPTVKSAVHLYEIPVPPHLHVSKQTPLQANGQFSPIIYVPSSFSLLPLLRFFIILTFHCFCILLFYRFFFFFYGFSYHLIASLGSAWLNNSFIVAFCLLLILFSLLLIFTFFLRKLPSVLVQYLLFHSLSS